jgi:hypothetical protein
VVQLLSQEFRFGHLSSVFGQLGLGNSQPALQCTHIALLRKTGQRTQTRHDTRIARQ